MPSATPIRKVVTPPAPREMEPTNAIAMRNGEGRSTSRLIWLGVAIVIGVLLVKQIPDVRRYLRLERM